MSLANMLVGVDRAYLVTDSGYFNEKGELALLAPKVMEFVDQRVAVSCVGSGITLAHLARYMSRPSDMTQMDLLENILTGVRRAYAAESLCPERNYTRWLVAFYSAKHGRALGMSFFTNPADGAADQEAWTWYGAPCVIMPHVPHEIGRGFDPEADFMPIVERQWEIEDWPVGESGRRVAGEIVLTSVSADGIDNKVLHDYGAFGCATTRRFWERLLAEA